MTDRTRRRVRTTSTRPVDIAIVCFAVLLVIALAGAYWQRSVQAGIDANLVQLRGEVTGQSFSLTGRNPHSVTYDYQGRRYERTITSLATNVNAGSRVCLEIDRTSPGHARACDSLGSLAFFEFAVIIVGALTTTLLLLRIALALRARRGGPPGTDGTPRRRARRHAAG
jgi:hypothetical protein